MRLLPWLLIVLSGLASTTVWAVPSLFEAVSDGVYVVHDDTGHWAGHMSKDITHQNRAEYQARKTLDLTNVPEEVWARTKSVRLAVFFMVCDYSWHDNPPANGLDESYEIVVNGQVHRYPDNDGAPVFVESAPPTMAWYDHVLPKDEFLRGPNEIIIRKAPSNKNDDYVYLGIDMSEKRGNSTVTFDGKTWTQDRLTVPGGNGEYMVRLYLICKDTHVKVAWRPGQKPELDDPDKLVEYAGYPPRSSSAHGGVPERQGRSKTARLEWNPLALDQLEPLTVTVDASGPMQLSWLDDKGQVLPDKTVGSTMTLPPNSALRPSGLVVAPSDNNTGSAVRSVTVETARSFHPLPERLDMCPLIAAPAGKPAQRPPTCQIEGATIRLENAGLRCEFTTGPTLTLASIYNEYTGTQMVTDPTRLYLFLVEVNGRRYAGSRDFRCASVKPSGKGFSADLTLAEPALRATLTVAIDEEGLRFGLSLANTGGVPVDFKLAFPHLAGLVASDKPAGDYYFYPLGGGIQADTPALIRTTYGEYQALYQVMDLYSPQRGGGLYLRADDREGWYKGLALRKHVPRQSEVEVERISTGTADEYQWTNPLEQVDGTSFACEYLRRTREPGRSFEPSTAVLAAHAGDWHATMEAYSAWAHRVWKFRPYPSRLKSVRDMMPHGWAGDFLFKDGKYRTDMVEPPPPGVGRTMTDCVELMSWWDWSPLGPFATPFDKLKDVLTDAQIRAWQPYFVKDPVTGQTMWNDQPNDYTGYNERFGGLPAFRQCVATCQQQGALVTLYTDPFRLDYNCDLARQKGKLWGVIGPDGKYTTAYEVWNPCHDDPEVRQWVASTMKRVMRETGADGLRLDEYGHGGYTCFSTLHEHTYEERGVSQWNKGVAETIRMIHAGVDEVRPGLVVTTEFPAYDYMMQYLEGCITYDLSLQATTLRPLECNLQRFYFPECKPYELDHRHAPFGLLKKFWNAEESFEQYYPINMHLILGQNEDVYQGRDFRPLVPSLAQHVYVNQFGGNAPGSPVGPSGTREAPGGAKTIYHLYNATGHTFEGRALTVTLKPGEHLFDLLNCREVRPEREGAVWLYLPRDEVACLARLPKLLAVTTDGKITPSQPKLPAGKLTLVVCGSQGEALTSQDLRAGVNTLDLSTLAVGAQPACVKLMRDGTLLDAVEMPLG